MKDVQQQGGSYESQSEFIGLERQLTIDTTNQRILLHDGETPGGIIFVPMNEGDARWMMKIPELLGFADFAPGVKGFPARGLERVYALRSILGVDGAISTTNPEGTDGDVLITLDDIISKDLMFIGGEVRFGDIFYADVGMIGDVEGDLTGDSQGTHYGPVNGDIVGDTTGTHTGPVIGSVDARGPGGGIQVDDDSIPMSAIAGLDDALTGINGVPIGFIGMWYGVVADIPAGWVLCDGDNGTPDLRDRFIVCAGTNAPHDSGGLPTFTPAGTIAAGGEHSHAGDADGHILTIPELPAHAHTNGVCDDSSNQVFNRGGVAAGTTTPNSIESNSADGTFEGNTSTIGAGNPHVHTLSIADGGNHTHVFEGTEAEIVPPYYSLCMIMKV